MPHLWYLNPEPQMTKELVLLEELKAIHNHNRIMCTFHYNKVENCNLLNSLLNYTENY